MRAFSLSATISASLCFLLICSVSVSSVGAFTPPALLSGFQFPKIEFPWDNNNNGNINSSSRSSSSTVLQPGDTVAVIGASGNVGKLVALRLSDTYKVHGVVRDSSSNDLMDFFGDRLSNDQITLYQSDLLAEMRNDGDDGSNSGLQAAIQNANAIVICTGTTAFPTKGWSKNGEYSITNEVIRALLDSKFNIPTALQSLDALGLNTPNNIDNNANQHILNSWLTSKSRADKKRIIMLSSIGVDRRTTMPFPILNACGVLDAKAAAENAFKQACATSSDNKLSYTIIRPGQLFGGPYDNNFYLGTLFQLDKDAETQDVEIGRGDELLGDTLRSTLAEITAQVCELDCARDMDFAVINVKGDVPVIGDVQDKLRGLV